MNDNKEEKEVLLSKEETIKDVVEALMDVIKEADYPIVHGYSLKYHMDVGLLVRIFWKGIPDIPIYNDWLFEGSGYNWLVHTIDENIVEGVNADVYEVVFLLEEDI